ncbi:MAG: acyltransferase [Coxiella sp. RIFCSPHIGHO2_12_FULL_44_14]|nr:MAG: acyltransferase [Coxiella sp. RIFCSPHIGHO2_12_FULL_44_14]
MKNNKIKVAVVQQAGYAKYEKSLQVSVLGIQEAAAKGAQLILLQELHTGFYFCQVEDVRLFAKAETIPGPTTERLAALAAELNVVIVASLFEKRAPGLYHNTAVVLEKNGTLAGIYRKMHIPEDPGFYEKFYFTPGDLGFTPITTSIARLGVLVCWDQWYPEGARLMALSGAEILLYPTAIGWGTLDADPEERQRQQQAWFTIQRAHAIANGLPIMVANRIGVEVHPENSALGIEFWGSSFIAGPQGEILAEASLDQAEVVIAEIDKARIENVRCGWPFLRDRRIDAYDGIVKRYIDKNG